MKNLFCLFLFVFAMALTTGNVLADPVNKKCPVSGQEVDTAEVVKYTATFCCNNCAGKFKKDPLAYAKKVSKAKKGECPFSGKAVDKEATATVSIAACCGKCKKKIAANPAKFFGKLQKDS